MTWLQFVVAFFCLKALGYAGRFFPAISNHIGICQYSFSKDIFTKTAALGFAYVAMYVLPRQHRAVDPHATFLMLAAALEFHY